MTDLLSRLTNARPTDADLDAAWSTEERAAMLRRVRAESTSAVRRPGRRRTWLAIAAAVSAVAVVTPILDGGEAQARTDILRLASAASKAEGLGFTPGTFLHVKTESLEENSRLFGDGETRDTNREAWIRWDGAQWAIDTRPSAGWTEYHFFAARKSGDFEGPTPEFVAQLPDGPAELRQYLDATVSGSNSHDEALFVAVSDLAHSHLLDPATLAVALRAIADVDGVQTEDVVVDGRAAVKISYRRFHLDLLGVHSITIDKETAQVLRVAQSALGETYTSTTTRLESVKAIPAKVLGVYEKYDSGTRICADGREATGDGVC